MEKLLWNRGKTLGRGGFGVVSLASTSNPLINGVTLPSLIAVKSCKYTYSQSLKEEEKFLHIFKLSPYIIRCFGANVSAEDGVVLYNLLLEYASGGSLANRLQNYDSGLPESEVKKHLTNVLLGLSCMHNKGIIHCDIKPANILLVGTEETAKIADFGLCMTVEQGIKEKHGQIRGTERYMAPESVLYGDYGPQVDIWALGCTVYELITGTPLYEYDSGSNEDDDNLLYKIGFEEPKFQDSNLSDEAQDFLKKCLAKDPSSRWTADMLLNHPFVLNSPKVTETAKTREKPSGSVSTLLHKPLRKIRFKHGNRKKPNGSMSLQHKPIRKITFKHGNRKFVIPLQNLKQVE